MNFEVSQERNSEKSTALTERKNGEVSMKPTSPGEFEQPTSG